MHSSHSITRCSICDTVISQCRCMSQDKTVTYAICNKCREEETTEDQVRYSNPLMSNEVFLLCRVHGTPYPKGAKCPACEDETTRDKTIEPCPFCGGNNIEVDAAGLYDDDESYTEWMVCTDCSICGPASKNAVESWNRRKK